MLQALAPYFAAHYTGEPFHLFGPPHLAALGLVALFNLSFLLLRRSRRPGPRRAMRYGLAVLLVLNEIGLHTWAVLTGQWTVQVWLPLHLSGLLVWVSAAMLLTRSYAIYELTYFLGIGSAIQTLLTPTLGPYGFPHYRFIEIFISHGIIFSSAVFMTVVEGYRPRWRSLLKVALWTNVFMALVAVVNLLLDSNYLFICAKPGETSLLDLLGPWPWYILGMEAVGLVTCLLLYLPFAVKDWAARR